MRCVILCFVVLALGCGSQIVDENPITIGKATQLINAFGAPTRAEIMVFDNGWSDWVALNKEHAANILELLGECNLIRFHYPDGPAPSFQPPRWVVRYTFENDRELTVRFLGSGNLICLGRGDSMKLLKAGEQHAKLVELLEFRDE